ncbi:putative trehalase [Micractinium conductrix]|uniref:Trehalase n=1 Tax=Micractinium conductrix TaxID=554055 RepID=A0A2P6VH36_9CHLO|nr:putative trehalase [Micractinium conductrix]|eukprot:PSC73401.1 putative trehalase [Micractinium conductrix]
MRRGGLALALAVALVATAATGAAATSFTGNAGKAGDTFAKRPWMELLSWKPRAYLYHHFLSDEECDHIIKISSPHMQRSGVVNMDGSVTEDGIRTSWGTFLTRAQDEVVFAIEHRVANWSHLPVEHAEDMQVLRYQNNQTYGAHWDDLDESESPAGLGGGSVRVATVLIYLSDAEEGGETAFPHSRWLDKQKQAEAVEFSECAKDGVAAQARKGNALLFWDTKVGSMRQDKWSMHTGCPVLKGTKWTAVKWIHAKQFGGPYPARPLATSGESLARAQRLLEEKQARKEIPRPACLDSNEGCREWADNGECSANPKFMTKACRLSCGVCCPEGDVLCERRRKRTIAMNPHGPLCCVGGASRTVCGMWAATPRLALALAMLAAALAAVGAQEDEQAACTALPLPPGAAGIFLDQSDNGVTNPALLQTLVKEVDTARVYPDSKTIVDMPLKAPPAEVAAAFEALQLPEDPQARNQTLFDFVQQWLNPPGSDMIPAQANWPEQPPEWFDSLESLPEIREWAHSLYEIWGRLARQLAPEVFQRPELYTMLPIPNFPFVIPGARFREIYYWDSYWVLKGLLASNLTGLATDIVSNFRFLVATYGHIPNGIRTYYLNRSQPPLFSEMVRIVYEATGNRTLLSFTLPALLREHAYFNSPPKQVVAVGPEGQQFNVSRYYAHWEQPRPESYIEDVETARKAGLDPDNPDARARQLWRDLASGAESGWDYSTRWFADGQTLETIRTTLVIPADLNAFLMQMEENIADFAAELGCAEVEAQYRELAAERRDALNTLFWDPETAQWHDLICTPDGVEGDLGGTSEEEALSRGQVAQVCRVERNPSVFASNWVPLWAGAVDPGSVEALAAVEALNSSGLIGIAGVPMSLTESGQQWDYPNVWPPVDWMLIDGLDEFGGQPGQDLARVIAERFLRTVYATWAETGRMFEKFNAEEVGLPGGGGEYEVVDGFGWTNGASLDLLQRFGADWA